MSLADLAARARALLSSDRVTEPTRRALLARLDERYVAPQALDAGSYTVLRAVAARLLPLGDLQDAVDPAARLDAQLARGGSDGWRYAELPPDREAVAAGLQALDREVGAPGFAALSGEAQDALLSRVQAGEVRGWPFPPDLWFEEMLAALSQLAYAHPLVQASIGYNGQADARGFQDVGLNPHG